MSEISEYIRAIAVRARSAAGELRKLSTAEKNEMLMAIAESIESAKEKVRSANEEDIAAAKAAGIAAAMIDRLTLNDARYAAMTAGVSQVASLPDPVGEELWRRERPSGISIRKIREPLGVIAVVFESRPNVFVDTAALCLKTSNAIILRGGKEAIRTNAALAAAVRGAFENLKLSALADAVQLVERTEHEGVRELVRLPGLVDVAIPRGGERLIRAMCEAALIPVLKHYKGVCHLYVDDEADLAMAMAILDNAKRQRPSACNAVECLLVHERLAPLFLKMVEAWAEAEKVRLRRPTADEEWGEEFLGLELNIGVVSDYRAAISHINRHGSHHSDAIITNNAVRAQEFLRDVDSACVYHNASTRFTDGAEFGMGAEIGISTDKLHARGPMGLEELTTYKYVVSGDGTIRQ